MTKVYLVVVETHNGDFIKGVFTDVCEAYYELEDVRHETPEYAYIKESYVSSLDETVHFRGA